MEERRKEEEGMKLKRRDTCHFMMREISTCQEGKIKREKPGAAEVHYKLAVLLRFSLKEMENNELSSIPQQFVQVFIDFWRASRAVFWK